MPNITTGDSVEWDSLTSGYVFRGVVEGFYGKGAVAFCTDQTGRPSRPVKVERLRRGTINNQHRTGRAA